MKLIGISQNVVYNSERGEYQDVLDQRYIKFCICAGLLPIPIPNHFMDLQRGAQLLERWISDIKIHGFILTGGNDIGDFPNRDKTETFLINFALKSGFPLLGICRGMQLLGHISNVKLKPLENHVGVRHEIFGEIFGFVNSYHNFSLDICPDEYDILARAADQNIEAMRHKKRPIEAWMWHPERGELNIRDVERVKELFGVVGG